MPAKKNEPFHSSYIWNLHTQEIKNHNRNKEDVVVLFFLLWLFAEPSTPERAKVESKRLEQSDIDAQNPNTEHENQNKSEWSSFTNLG